MIATTCPNCGGEISSTAKFCRHCKFDLRIPPPSSSIWSEEEAELEAPVMPEITPRRRSPWVIILVILALLLATFCILGIMVYNKALQSRATGQIPTVEFGPADTVQPVVVEMVVPTASSPQGQPVNVPVLPPTASSSSLSASQYDIVVAGGGDHPDGELSYTSPQPPDCMGGCGSYSGILELRGIRIVNQGFVLDAQIQISQASGDSWLFGANFWDTIVLEINGQMFKPTASSFPTQVTSSGLMTGYLSFSESIPVTADGQYKVTLTISDRMQPVEGWLLSVP